MKKWLKDNWFLILVILTLAGIGIFAMMDTWASYQCVEAGFLGGTIRNFRVVCFVLWR